MAGIETVDGRAYHGIKRRFATAALDRRAASKQSGTNEETLGKHYEQDDLASKIELAKNLNAQRTWRSGGRRAGKRDNNGYKGGENGSREGA